MSITSCLKYSRAFYFSFVYYQLLGTSCLSWGLESGLRWFSRLLLLYKDCRYLREVWEAFLHIGLWQSIQTILSSIAAGTEVELFAFHNVDCISQMASLTYWHLLTRLRVSITKHFSTFLYLLYLSICSLSSLSCGLQFLINQPPVQGRATTCLNTTLAKACAYILVNPQHHSAHLSLPLSSMLQFLFCTTPQCENEIITRSHNVYFFTMFLFHYKNPGAYIAHSHVNFPAQSCISLSTQALTLKP